MTEKMEMAKKTKSIERKNPTYRKTYFLSWLVPPIYGKNDYILGQIPCMGDFMSKARCQRSTSKVDFNDEIWKKMRPILEFFDKILVVFRPTFKI